MKLGLTIFSLLLVLFTGHTGSAETNPPPYCLALRGNGEAEPAHWGALANLIEKMGLPKAQAGGSSAAISMFLLEAIAANPEVALASAKQQRLIASFLLKSIYGISIYLAKTPEAQAALDLIKTLKEVQSQSNSDIWKTLQDLADHPETMKAKRVEIERMIGGLEKLGILRVPRYEILLDKIQKIADGETITAKDTRYVSFYSQDLHNTLKTLGAFDAEDRDLGRDLFLRDGIINFSFLGLDVGHIASFLAGRWDRATHLHFNNVLNLCLSTHAGKTWQELIASEPRCQIELEQSLNFFFAQRPGPESFATETISERIETFPTTAVLVGSAAATTETAMDIYHYKLDREGAAKAFVIKDTSQVRFGYWGKAESLAAIARDLKRTFRDSLGRTYDFSRDLKSDKFSALDQPVWREVLRFSPAEPGLASLQEMTVKGKKAYSAGGWSDLHPVPVLKAFGCDRVIYVTRKGGESLFGQGIAKRLLDLKREWDFLRTNGPETEKARNVQINNQGDPIDMTSTWSQLYNVANPNSSYMKSVRAADAVLCTDWNSYDAKSQLSEIVAESYHAPYVLGASAEKSLATLLGAKNIVTDPSSPAWVGCR